jgi:hypothetical protein
MRAPCPVSLVLISYDQEKSIRERQEMLRTRAAEMPEADKRQAEKSEGKEKRLEEV